MDKDEIVGGEDFLNYCNILDNEAAAKEKIEELKEEGYIQNEVPEGSYNFRIEEYVFMFKDKMIGMFTLLTGNPVSGIIQTDMRNMQPLGHAYPTPEEARKELEIIIKKSEMNGWKVGYRGPINLG